MGLIVVRIQQGAPTGIAILDAMPMAHTSFAVLPTEENNLRSKQAGEIEQPLLNTFAHATVAMDFLDETFDLPHAPRNLAIFLQPIHQLRGVGIEALVANYRFRF